MEIVTNIQKILYDKLSNNSTLQNMDISIYPSSNSKNIFPCITFGNDKIYDNSTKTEQGFEHVLPINIWSNKCSQKEVKNIMSVVYEDVHNIYQNLDGNAVWIYFVAGGVQYNHKMKSYNGNMVFEAKSQAV